MKVLISILIGFLVVGCGKNEQPKEKADSEITSRVDDKNSARAKPSKELKKEDLVGTYEGKIEDDTERWIFHGSGEFEWSSSDKRYERSLEDVLGDPPHGRWTVAQNREVHLKWYGTPKTSGEEIMVFSINTDGSITHVADISDGDRQDYKEDLDTFKKIK